MKEFTRSCSHILNNMLCTSSLVVQFSKINAAHFRSSACPVFYRAMPCRFFATAYLLYHFLFGLSRGFSKVFWSFFRSFILTFDSTPRLPKKRYFLLPRFGRSIIVSLFFPFVKGFSKSFFGFFLIRFLEAFPAFGRIGFLLGALFECLHSIPLFSPLVNPFS